MYKLSPDPSVFFIFAGGGVWLARLLSVGAAHYTARMDHHFNASICSLPRKMAVGCVVSIDDVIIAWPL